MQRRIGLWALCGLGVALFWVILSYGLFFAFGPGHGVNGSWAIVLITAPAALLHHYRITWYEFIAINTAIYTCMGMAVETIRGTLRFTIVRPRH
jgi:hypothetical protein